MTLRAKRMCLAAGIGGGVAALVVAEPVVAYLAVLAPLRRPAGAPPAPPAQTMHQAAAHWAAWTHSGGYLPWHVWAALLLRHPHALLVVLVVALAGAGLMAWSARGKATVTWGGPPPAGRGQHGTAHWRTHQDLARGFTLWVSPKQEVRVHAAVAEPDGESAPKEDGTA